MDIGGTTLIFRQQEEDVKGVRMATALTTGNSHLAP
jgi:hypothetical protein